jgi:hypothetical protein
VSQERKFGEGEQGGRSKAIKKQAEGVSARKLHLKFLQVFVDLICCILDRMVSIPYNINRSLPTSYQKTPELPTMVQGFLLYR